jgi:hypothetical protein
MPAADLIGRRVRTAPTTSYNAETGARTTGPVAGTVVGVTEYGTLLVDTGTVEISASEIVTE